MTKRINVGGEGADLSGVFGEALGAALLGGLKRPAKAGINSTNTGRTSGTKPNKANGPKASTKAAPKAKPKAKAKTKAAPKGPPPAREDGLCPTCAAVYGAGSALTFHCSHSGAARQVSRTVTS